MAYKVKRTSSFGDGCLFQILSGVVFVAAFILFAPMRFGWLVALVIGAAVFLYGSSRARWYECSACGSRVGRESMCRNCRGRLD